MSRNRSQETDSGVIAEEVRRHMKTWLIGLDIILGRKGNPDKF